MITDLRTFELPGADLDLSRMPGHWLLARMGKRVLRPGGLELTRKMLAALAVNKDDHVVEFAPGLGTTTRIVLGQSPASYTCVDRDPAAARAARRVLRPEDTIHQGSASHTGLDPESATVVFGEAMLTMHTAAQKQAIVQEAHRVLREGGRYGIHELALMPDDLPETDKKEVQQALSDAIRVGARPLTVAEWRDLLEDAGFDVTFSATAPMHLLESRRLIADEGVLGAMRITANILRTPPALRRVLTMRSVFKRYASQMCALTVVARKRKEASR